MEVISTQPAIKKVDLWDTSPSGKVKCTSKYNEYKRHLKRELPKTIDYDPAKPILADITLWDTEVYSISEYLKAPIDVVSWNLHPTKNDQNVRQIKITRVASNDPHFSIGMTNVED